MENLGLKGLLCLLITWTTVVHVEANFHIVNKRNTGSDVITLVPSNNWACGGVETNYAALGQYPDCSGGDIRIPDGQCGWSGVKIRPSCSGGYFGKLYGGSGEPQGLDMISVPVNGSWGLYDNVKIMQRLFNISQL
ncbi:hypothetical protein AXG93_764s1010 [Marchantia polymorpha subsp. ruderalis]|uniref:Expansin-like EG45 domain-containing protein n=1 Tax=Marchantia polymorpha subsp. ruderalis TaxID=1480154 RepID=A0A176VMC5_MARPO|nr:hypothetical protein AXG93_764s1010 [Marchantia polymorpha subsp. ruderalis]